LFEASSATCATRFACVVFLSENGYRMVVLPAAKIAGFQPVHPDTSLQADTQIAFNAGTHRM